MSELNRNTPSPLMSKLSSLLRHEASGGILLMIATVLALVISNTGVAWYPALLDTQAEVIIGELAIQKPLLLWINDGLMAVFFLLVGLELKREVLHGELSERKNLVLPLAAAIGGLALPALIFAFINRDGGAALNGWAIPAATDIAFALGVLAILGSRVPVALKILLTSVAVIDDLAAIVIIAIFYTNQLSLTALLFSGIFLLALFILNRLKVKSLTPYILVGIMLWTAVLKSGVHATLAGVALAMFIPAGRDPKSAKSMADNLEHYLHSWVIYFILPVFAFANAGIPLSGLSLDDILKPVPLGIALGLILGKQIGIFGMCWATIKSGLVKMPKNVTWTHLYGLSCLCGIGFTMSLFIASLAFEGSGADLLSSEARLGILTGSLVSGVIGYIVLRRASRKV